ncbi:MAG: hypothetical protein M3O02_00930 [Acidobacteriota bacterium]|nr:hypothetical protein [Acidobacteriota bacterium]
MACAKPLLAIDTTDEMWAEIPDHLQQGLVRYLDHGVLPGSFLTACLSNVMKFLFTGVPSASWGNATSVEKWFDSPLRKRLLMAQEQQR